MPFPFLKLPPEIRNKVYNLLLITSHPHRSLTPDIIGQVVRGEFEWNMCPDMGDSVSLLRTCKLVHQEASSILYGSNWFYFMERPSLGEDDEDEDNGGADIPICDHMFVYPWLRLIGAQNRMHLRNLRLHFTGETFFYCRGESNRFTSEVVTRTGGEYLVDALEFLGRGHALAMIEIVFSPLECTDTEFKQMFQHLFRRRSESRLIRQMESFSGLKQLIVGDLYQEEMESCPEAYASFLSVKMGMEGKQPAEEPQGSVAAKPSHGKSLAKKIKELVEERDRLELQALETNQKLRDEVGKLQAIEDTLSQAQNALSEAQKHKSIFGG
ncbi:MAG: hypothetical protein FRX48_09550 [Lasallia pustulata]|uniref:F-box domain-containing protein n=1 Tax=Lasallia pustulata TaxID=136370 RepID=A0A5M8PCF6_9LECA|nr:MAG: hypothetical protein FRX48_09550 [Lasallia pustulata]